LRRKKALGSERDLVEQAVGRTLNVLRADRSPTINSIRKAVRDRMSDHAGIICVPSDVKASLAAARSFNESTRQKGIAFEGAYEAARALQWQQTALLSETVLTALVFYVERGGGSRGARAICAAQGDRAPKARTGPLEDFRFIPERVEDRAEHICVRFEAGKFVCETPPIRRSDRDDEPFFERDWPDFLTGAIHDPAH
jgi:hypothetical protein